VREGERSVCKKLREREAKKLNVVFYRIGEMEGEGRQDLRDRSGTGGAAATYFIQ
jgi:hypothetical protein